MKKLQNTKCTVTDLAADSYPEEDKIDPDNNILLNNKLNIILLYAPTSSKRSFPVRCSHRNCVCISHLSHAFYMTRQTYSPTYHITKSSEE